MILPTPVGTRDALYIEVMGTPYRTTELAIVQPSETPICKWCKHSTKTHLGQNPKYYNCLLNPVESVNIYSGKKSTYYEMACIVRMYPNQSKCEYELSNFTKLLRKFGFRKPIKAV